jgi:hypothetical protein
LNAPYYDGLNSALSSQTDNGDGQGSYTAGRDRILQVMAAAPDHSVVLDGVGSLRDVAAAYNKNPTLFTQKLKMIYTSGGAQGSPWDANWGSDKNAVRRLLNQHVPMTIAFCGASGQTNNGSQWLMDLPKRMAATDRMNPKLSQVFYWAYWGGQEGSFRYKHYRLDTERYAAFGLSRLDPSPWAGTNHPPMPANIEVADVMADPQAFFDEPMTKSYTRESFNLTLSDELRNPPAGSDGSVSPFGIKGMWSVPLFLDAVGLNVFRNATDPTQVQLSFQDDLGAGWQKVYNFDPATYTFSSDQFYYTPSTEQNATTHVFGWYTATNQEYQDIINAVDNALVGTYLPRRGDANRSGGVDFADYQILEVNFGKTASANWLMGDFDFDHDVDFADYQALEANFGQGGDLVPEPATLLLACLGALAILRRR